MSVEARMMFMPMPKDADEDAGRVSLPVASMNKAH